VQYDGVKLLGMVLDNSINRGIEFEDAEIFNKEIRKSKWTGCSGKISFETETNNRSFTGMELK
jgi:hypothetical protein